MGGPSSEWGYILTATSHVLLHFRARLIIVSAVIYAGFFGCGASTKCLGGPIFRGLNEILLLGKALKFGLLFQKFALKLINICKIIGKIREKCISEKFFNFIAGNNFLIIGKGINMDRL